MHECKNQLNAHSKNEVNPRKNKEKEQGKDKKKDLTLNLFKDNKHAD